MTDTTRIAVIAPLTQEDHGFDWGTEREHVLLNHRDRDAVEEWASEYARSADTYCSSEEDELLIRRHAERIADALCDADTPRDAMGMMEHGWDVSKVDIDEGVTDEWPSAGGADHWTNDVWLGLADYLSAKQWATLIGRPVDYTLTDEDAGACVRNSGIDAVRDALVYLTESDPIWATLVRALGEQTWEDDVAAHDHAHGDDSDTM